MIKFFRELKEAIEITKFLEKRFDVSETGVYSLHMTEYKPSIVSAIDIRNLRDKIIAIYEYLGVQEELQQNLLLKKTKKDK